MRGRGRVGAACKRPSSSAVKSGNLVILFHSQLSERHSQFMHCIAAHENSPVNIFDVAFSGHPKGRNASLLERGSSVCGLLLATRREEVSCKISARGMVSKRAEGCEEDFRALPGC